MEKVEIKFKRTKEIILILLALFTLICGLWLMFIAQAANEKVISQIVLIFFGFLLLLILKQIFYNAPRLLIIDDKGIEDTSLGVGKIYWDDIETAYLNNVLTNKFISLKIKDVEKYLSRLSKSSRIIATSNTGYGFEIFNLHLVGSTISQKDLLNLINSRINPN